MAIFSSMFRPKKMTFLVIMFTPQIYSCPFLFFLHKFELQGIVITPDTRHLFLDYFYISVSSKDIVCCNAYFGSRSDNLMMLVDSLVYAYIPYFDIEVTSLFY
jgi:hypothetical protein